MQARTTTPAWRHFCKKCGSPLWLWDPHWPHLIHPHASAIDTPLPKAALEGIPEWIDVPTGAGHARCNTWPEQSLREWHERHGLLASTTERSR